MSFRFEEKYIVNIKYKNHLMNYLNEFDIKQLYPERTISSIYFDNFYKEMFLHSEEGLVPRKKLRIRKYPSEENSKFFFEKKINSVEGKYKISQIIKKNKYIEFLREGIFDKNYGICKPQVEVNYNREYYKLRNLRVTIDSEIKYKKFNSNINFNNNNILICEFKSTDIKNIKNFYNSEIFSKVRISKYCDAVEKLFN